MRNRVWVGALLALAACATRPDPEEVLRAFLKDVHDGKADAAWNALTESSQKELEARHAALAAATGDDRDMTPARMLLGDLGLTVNQPESIAVASPHGQEVSLRVAVKDGRSADIRMVREGDRWKVDLMGSLKKARPLEEKLKGKVRADTSTVP